MWRLLLVVLVFAVGLAAAGSAEFGAPLNVTVVVLDGFGAERRDWVVEVVGVGRGVGEVKALLTPGRSYTVRVSAPFFTYATNVTVADAVVFVKVPTAKLSVAAVDDYGKPIDIYVTEVRLEGPSRPPKDVEVLAGVYDVDVIAVGRWGTTRVRLAPGEDRTITVTVPGTASIDIGPSPNPWALPAFLLAFAADVAVTVTKGRATSRS
jgi:hypothetical protein